MYLNLKGPGFEAEVATSPDLMAWTGARFGELGFEFAEFDYREQGGARVWVDGVQIGACLAPRGVVMDHAIGNFALSEDSIVSRTPGSLSQATWRQGFHGQFLLFAPEAIERLFQCPLSRLTFRARDMVTLSTERPVLSHILAALSSNLVEGNPAGSMFLESLGVAALRSVVDPPYVSNDSVRALSLEKAKVLRDLIHGCLAEQLSLSDLADAVDLSVGHMLRAFKITFGSTPHQYIMRARADRAMHLLKTTRLNLDEVARASGLVAGGQMARTLKSLLGQSPRDIRKLHRTADTESSPQG